MRNRGMRVSVAAMTAAAAIVTSACGAASAVKQAVDPVARAAEVTARVPGYRMSGEMSVNTPVGVVRTTMSGIINRATRTGQMTTSASVAGHAFTLSARLSGLTVYIDASTIPGADQLTHGKRWLKMDMSRAFGSMGLGSLSASSEDPSQFVDYLRAVSDSTKKVGTATIRGVATTRYHAVVDLHKYPNLVGSSQRPIERRAIATMVSALGTHTLPIDVWIDGSNRVRRVSFHMVECVSSQKLDMGMTMDLYDYGPQPVTQTPSSSQAFDLTPLMSASVQSVKLGCSRATA